MLKNTGKENSNSFFIEDIDKLSDDAEYENLLSSSVKPYVSDSEWPDSGTVRKRSRLITVLLMTVSLCAVFIILGVIIALQPQIERKRNYARADSLLESEQYDEAYKLLKSMGEYELVSRNKYDRAMALIESEDYTAAYELLDRLDYSDSTEKREEIRLYAELSYMSRAEQGSVVIFGKYEQDNNTNDYTENIEWLVLVKDESRLLLVSRDVLDCQPYNKERTFLTWEDCSLRRWLNEEFINAAFTETEKNIIENTHITADKNTYYLTESGNDTYDRIFLLSLKEGEKLFPDYNSRIAKPTAYAKFKGVNSNEFNRCWWWLRSPGASLDFAAVIYYEGTFDYYGDFVDTDFIGVRPALWVNLK